MALQDPPLPGSVEGQKAGVVAYRQEPDGTYAILIITARRQRDAWIFPVGTVDPGETLEQAAARECMEESGYTVRTGPLLKALDLAHKNGLRHFSFFAAQVTGEVDEYETDRRRRWVPLAQLVETVSEAFAPVARAALAHLSA
ncbi:MAG: NUDIX domain-containing protein [Desulfurellaceae bacterium]|nr:NUDIX domain-containing protein [Desulfurellaceae bacterium]